MTGSDRAFDPAAQGSGACSLSAVLLEKYSPAVCEDRWLHWLEQHVWSQYVNNQVCQTSQQVCLEHLKRPGWGV